VGDFETKTIRAQACFSEALELRKRGVNPDIIIAHPGWGESLFLKEVWPKARMGIYCEFYYRASGVDIGFDSEFSPSRPDDPCRIRIKNLNNLLHFQTADAGISPTHWQAETFPVEFRDKITVVHDGIDTDAIRPNPAAKLSIATSDGQRIDLSRDDEVITFVNRNLEPYRGYHVFMRSLPSLLSRRPNARVLLVGGDGVSYGARPPDGRTWKDLLIEEVRPRLSDDQWARVHFLGQIPYSQFVPLLQLSTVHVYLTYPFVLSWSLLEAMSAGCAIVASDTAPLREVIHHGKTGCLVDFFDQDGLVETIDALMNDPDRRHLLGMAARSFAREQYDLRRVCLPRQIEWVRSLG
jgi:glycosyltransferase involved in cell wall biosynthesis